MGASAGPDRRTVLGGAMALVGSLGFARTTAAQPALPVHDLPFPQWVERTLRPLARARGVSDQTFDRIFRELQPDQSVYQPFLNQAEFRGPIWQYLNTRVSEWRITTGRQRLAENIALFERIERDLGVDRFALCSLWGNESAFGEVVTNPRAMRPVFPALSALAWGEPRRRDYWRTELLNALVIVERGWSEPARMVGSWAGAMGHTQWMPEVWLNVGRDYDGDGRVDAFDLDDALGSTATFLVRRGNWKRGEPWGAEVRVPAAMDGEHRNWRGAETRPLSGWVAAGIRPAGGNALPALSGDVRLWQPEPGGPGFLVGQNFVALTRYNPAARYALAVAHLGDRIRGDGPFVQPFPGGERTMTTAEIVELQQRLTAAGFDTGGTTGAVGAQTRRAVEEFQRRAGLEPADGYPGLRVLERLRLSR